MINSKPRSLAIAMASASRNSRWLGALLALPLLWALFNGMAMSQEETYSIPAPAENVAPSSDVGVATFAGGCFWGVQGVFQHVKGVKMAVSGYAGGAQDTASYETVSGGQTGHAETVKITYDPKVVSYGELLQVYFSVAHNPTELNFQGPDHGTQYRSTIFAANAEQAKVAKDYIAQLDAANIYPGKIVTTIETGKTFYNAEQYHQDFLTLNPTYPYIAYNDIPKVEALKKLFPQEYADQPVLVGSL